MCLRENLNVLGKIKKSTSFSDTVYKYCKVFVPIEKEVTNIDKDGNESVVTISYKTKFIDSARFMATSLSNLVDNLTEGVHKIKCKDCDQMCLSCSTDSSNKIDEELKKQFKNIFMFSNNDTNKFILLLRKGVYIYKYMDE